MKAVRIFGDPPRLDIAQVPTPAPGTNEVLVRVAAAGLNRADILQARGAYPAPPGVPADIPGLEFAGTVEALGPGCFRVAPGQRVFGLSGGGAHAEYLVSPEALLMQIPQALDDAQAAATPEAFITAYDALVMQASIKPGDRVLIHAVASGVGLAAVQLACAWACEVFGTTRSPQKLERLRALDVRASPTSTIPHFFGPDSFDDEIRTRTSGTGVDVILDPVGGAYFERNLKALAMRGRLVIIATMGGATVTLPLGELQRRRLQLIGTALRTRSLQEKAAVTRAFEQHVLPKLESGVLRTIIDRCYPLGQAGDAYSYMQSNANVGKIVLTMR